MGSKQVVNLLEIVIMTFQALSKDKKIQRRSRSIKARRNSSNVILRNLNYDIRLANKMLDSYRLSSQEEMRKIHVDYRMLFLGVTARIAVADVIDPKARYASKTLQPAISREERR